MSNAFQHNMRNGRFVGRVMFLDANDKPQFSAYYAQMKALRPVQIITRHGIYTQVRQEGDRWLYRFTSPLTQGLPVDAALLDYRDGSHAAWDGPKPPQPVATFGEVARELQRLIVVHPEAVPTIEVTELQRLFDAAVHQRPYQKGGVQ